MNAGAFLCGRLAVVIFLGLLMTGCASSSGANGGSVVVRSYDLPTHLDSNAVIQAVERSFSQALQAPARIDEGKVPSPLPAVPAQFVVEQRRVHLDRIGIVTMPHVVCPEKMAVVHGFTSDRQKPPDLRSYTGCIQLYAGGYRLNIIASAMASGDQERLTSSAESQSNSENIAEDMVEQIARELVAQVSEARLVPTDHAQEGAELAGQTFASTFKRPVSSSEEKATSSPTVSKDPAVRPLGSGEGTALPNSAWICLAPKRESITVISRPGEGSVVGTLHSGAVLIAAEPVHFSYFRVRSEQGPMGWVNRSDVERLACPIG